MAQLYMPDIAGTAMQGFQQGQQMRANRLIGAAMQNPDQAQGYLAQAGAINPQLAMGVQGQMQMQQDRQQAMQQAQQAQMVKKAGGVARYLLAARKSGDPAQMQGAWNAAYPYAAALAQEHGAPPPPQQWNDSLLPGLYQLAAATSSAFPDEAKPQIVTPGSTVRQYGENVYTNPAQAKIVNGMAVSQGPNGALVAAPIPITGTGAAPPNAGAQAPAPESGNVQFQFAPGTPPEVIAAAKAAAAANGDMPAQQPQGASQTLAQAIAANKPATAIEQKIALARKMGASEDDIKNMVLGSNAGDSGMGLLTPDGKALMDAAIAHGYNMPMPSMGYGKAGTAAKAAAINSLAARFKAAGKSPDEAVSQMIEGNTATSGLRSLQNINAKIGGWEQSAAKQADIALGMSNEVGRTGVPVFNSWLLAGRQATGDVKVAQFNNTVNTLAEEYAKVMSGGGSSAATDSTRALAHKMLNSAMTADQFAGVVAKMRQEMTARTEGLNAAVMSQRSSITSNEGGNMGGWDGQAAPTQAAQPQAAPTGAVTDYSHLWGGH